MTKLIELETPDHEAGLLPCCRHLAQQAGQVAFCSQLSVLREIPGPKGRQETLESVVRAGRAEGLQTIILRPQPDQLATLTGQMPAVSPSTHEPHAEHSACHAPKPRAVPMNIVSSAG